MRHQWWRFHHQSTALMETLEHWRQSFPEIQLLDRTTLLPNLEGVCTELESRFEAIERMLAGEAPEHAPQPVTLAIDKVATQALSHFQSAALTLTKTRLERLEALTRSLFNCVRDIKRYGEPVSSGQLEVIRADGAGPRRRAGHFW